MKNQRRTRRLFGINEHSRLHFSLRSPLGSGPLPGEQLRPRTLITHILLGCTVLLADTLSKLWAKASLPVSWSPLWFSLPIGSDSFVWQWTYVLNSGSAFGLGAGYSWTTPLLLTCAGILFFFLIFQWWRALSQRQLAWPWMTLASGALGNAHERLTQGAVTDFIDWSYAGHHWPAFNLADAVICLSIVILIVHTRDHFHTRS